jgi:hypothetical protein
MLEKTRPIADPAGFFASLNHSHRGAWDNDNPRTRITSECESDLYSFTYCDNVREHRGKAHEQ